MAYLPGFYRRSQVLRVTTTSIPTMTQGVAFTLTVQAVGGLAPYTWSLVTPNNTLPAGLTFINGVLSGTPTTPGSFSLNFRVTDVAGNTATSGVLNFQVVGVATFAVTTTNLPVANQNEAYTTTLQSINGTAPITWSLVAPNNVLTTGLTLNASSGIISGTPTVSETRSIQARATDALGATANSVVMSLVVNAMAPLVITSPTTLPTAAEGVFYSFTFTATGGVAPYTWSLVAPDNVVPSGMALVGPVLSGTPIPTSAGTYPLNVRVTDSIGTTTTTGVLNVQVQTAAAFVVTTTSLPAANRGASYTTTITASGNTGPVSWSLVAPNNVLPTGLTINSVSGVIAGTPTVFETRQIRARATDSTSAVDSGLLSLIVNQVLNLTITTPATLPSSEVDQVYPTRTFQTSGGWGDVDWQILSGSIPTGMTFDTETGELSGTPTAIDTYTFTLQATDSEGRVATPRAFTVNITAIGTGEGPHDFYLQQIARTNNIMGLENVGYWSLRSNASLDSLISTWPSQMWSYQYGSDPHPEAQDAAKLVMPHSLGTSDQLIAKIPGMPSTGTLMIITDLYPCIEFREALFDNSLNHKFYQIEQRKRSDRKADGSAGSLGSAIYIEPRIDYMPTLPAPALGTRNLRTYTMGGEGRFAEFGLLRGTPYAPTGNGAVVVDGHKQRVGVWARHWFELKLSEPGTAFTEWNAQYSPSAPFCTANIISAVIDGTDTVLTVDNGEVVINVGTKDEAISNWWADIYTENNPPHYQAHCIVTIADSSNPALNGVHTAYVDANQVLRIRGLAAAAGSGGTVSRHFIMFTWWQAEEDMEPFRVYYRVPITKSGSYEIPEFRHELNTSKKIEALNGFVITAPPTQTFPTVLTIGPHNIDTGDSLWISSSDVIPYGPYTVTVESPTEISIPVSVTTNSVMIPYPQQAIDELNLGDISTGDTFQIRWRTESTPVITYEEDMSAAILAALRTLAGFGNASVVKMSNQVYRVSFDTTRTTMLVIEAPIDFTPGGVTRIQQGVTESVYSGTWGRVSRPLVGYFRNMVLLKDLEVAEDDPTLFRKPVR